MYSSFRLLSKVILKVKLNETKHNSVKVEMSVSF
jgi:hypothetical protein